MKASYAAVGVVGLAIAGLWYSAGGAAGPQPADVQAAETIRVSAPVAHENLAVFFVHGPDTIDDSKVVTLSEALEKGWAVVHETGNVNTLAVENRSDDHDLFLQNGDMIKGGKQDRIVSTDLLVPAKSGRVAFPAHCVEQSRWQQRGGEAAGHFNKCDGIAVGNDMKRANILRDQGGVWKNVADNQTKLSRNTGVQVTANASPTSMQLALENPAVRARVAGYQKALEAAPAGQRNVVGVVFVVNGQVTCAEVYGSNGLFTKAWPKLLKAASEEALADKTAAACPAPPTCREVETFLVNAAKDDGPAPTATVVAVSNDGSLVSGRVGSDRVGTVAASGVAVTGNRVVTRQLGTMDNITVQQLQAEATVQSGAQPQPAILSGRVAVTQTRTVSGRGGNSRVNDAAIDNVGGNGVAPPQPEPATAGNRLNVNRVDNRSALMLEARDASKANAVVHRSYLKK